MPPDTGRKLAVALGNMADKPVGPIDARFFYQLRWADPDKALRHLPSEVEVEGAAIRPSSGDGKKLRESFQALVFAYGLSTKVLEKKVLVSNTEARDYDFVITWQSENRDGFFPVQLKELPSEEINPHVAIEDILDKLGKYSGKDNLSAAVCLNRRLRLARDPFQQLERLKIRELWLFGPMPSANRRWFISGNMLHSDPQYHEFECPTPEENVA